MTTKPSIHEVFSLRHNEIYRVQEEKPVSGRWLAVMARSIAMPEGERQPVRQTDSKPVEQAAICACQIVDDKWQWVRLSACTNESIGDLLFDANAEKDRWYYLVIEQKETA